MNNRYLKIILGLPLLAALLGGCVQENDYQGTDADALRRPLGIASLWAPANTSHTRATAVTSRAATITPLPTDGEVGFFVQAATPDYAGVNNRKGVYVAGESLWLPATGAGANDSIWLTGVTAKLAVYYPYDATQTTAGKLKLTSAVRADDTKDLWSTHFEANSRTKGIKLTLTQLYSRLSLTFVKLADAEYTGTSALTGLKLTGAGIYAGATYNPLDGTYTHGTAGFTAALSGVTIKGTNAAADDATKVDLLLPPYPTLTENITLTATVDTKEMKIVIPKAKLANALTAGKQYNITIKLKPTALVLGSIQTTDWDSQTAFNGDAEMENPPLEHVDLGLSFLIAPGNVIATSDGKGGYKYAFAKEQGYYSGTIGGGDYFAWNTIDPTVTNGYTGDWDDTRDACRKVGDGQWYTPTFEQYEMLINKGCVWGTYKMKDGTQKNGVYLGTALAPSSSDQDTYLFLPHAGCWYNGGLNPNVTYYWCYLNGIADNAYIFHIFPPDPDDVVVGVNYGGLTENNLLRCVRNK
ncbi:fimbrillin family protein [Bacteroides ovatus]|jgi:lipoprotein|uniref:fimbrillin family protein n=1 Tax=Bacteroides ovatus TaxID=28116 RepID=UPI00206ED299|nr:fimbrillin family protein [Bacteroides ovatus]UYI64345.1 MAG: fimbrillin family protein [Bacteroides ovatus]DAU81400.1 MAG TPA: Fimbrillin-like [Caudoviricetes sp.]